MMMTVLFMLAGLLLGAGVMWLFARQRFELIQQQAEADIAANLAQLQAQLSAQGERLAATQSDKQQLAIQLEQHRQILSEAQQKLAVLANRSLRAQELESQQLQWQQQLQEQAARLAAREEQVRQLQPLQQALEEARQLIQQSQGELMRLTAREQQLQTTLEQEQRQAAEKMQLLQDAREALSGQFKLLATDILEEKSRRFTEQNRENIGQLLGPLGERLQQFGKLVQDTYDKDSRERLTLEQELRRMQALNTRLNQDAVALTNALTGSNNKVQGNWGEMILERVLETSGLVRDREYRIQVSDTVETGDGGQKRYQPDVVIDLPEGKQLVIDAKVSLNAYVRYCAATDDAEREQALKLHIASMRAHIRSLSEKRYQDLYKLRTLDFVFMFVPVEPAYLLAVQHDMALFNEAFERRIMIVGPSTLLATLRTVSSIWRYEHQNQNAQDIARQGGALYDKLAGLVETLEKLGRQLSISQESYQTAMKQLSTGSGNLLGRAERLRKLGARTSKQLPGYLLDTENNSESDE